ERATLRHCRKGGLRHPGDSLHGPRWPKCCNRTRTLGEESPKMALQVVGTGFGRTGTLSLKNALEKLGFGPCYHMMEVFPRPDHVAMWHRLAFASSMDWDLIFRDFRATVDWPAARWWREIATHFPDAKVLLSVRDPEAW